MFILVIGIFFICYVCNMFCDVIFVYFGRDVNNINVIYVFDVGF